MLNVESSSSLAAGLGVVGHRQGGVVKESSGPANALQKCMRDLDTLHQTITALDKKLEPVTHAPSPEKEPNNNSNGATNIERDINQLAVIIERATERIGAIIDRVDL